MILLFNDLIVLIQYNLNKNKKERHAMCGCSTHIWNSMYDILYKE
jgi:hypothetical protein